MRVNGQYLKKYSDKNFDMMTRQIVEDWQTVYSDCKIVNITTAINAGQSCHALVVFEEVSP